MDYTTREYVLLGIIAIGVLLALGSGALFRGQPAQPMFHYPDPTPYVVDTQRIEVFSHNCIGWNVSC